MKITRIDADWVHVPIPPSGQHVSNFGRVASFDSVIVRIETDRGIVGWGEAKAGVGSAASCAGLTAIIKHDFAPLLLGQDARDITRLWDILGKSLDVPVWQLLGGRRAERMPAYASGGWADAAGIGAQLQGYIDKGGFGAVKMRVGVMDGTPVRSAARVRAARAALGPDVGLACDAHGSWTVADAKVFARLVEDCNLMWFEEPVSGDDKAGMAEVRASSSVPISAGESEFVRHDFRELAERRAADILQPDLAIAGGITEAVRIGAIASAFNLRLAPHLWSGAPAFAAGLAVAASSSAGFILEYSLGSNPMLHELIEESFPVKGGLVEIPERPGLGITVREDFVRRHSMPAS
jgi:L-alanine-DL-glutamate epimerase-like enolase superfamily enzyme